MKWAYRLLSKNNDNSQWRALVMNVFSTRIDTSHANEDIDTKMTDQENFTLQHCQNYQSAKAHLSFKTNHLTKPKIQSPSLFSHSGHFSNNGMCFTTFSVTGYRQAKAPQYVCIGELQQTGANTSLHFQIPKLVIGRQFTAISLHVNTLIRTDLSGCNDLIDVMKGFFGGLNLRKIYTCFICPIIMFSQVWNSQSLKVS